MTLEDSMKAADMLYDARDYLFRKSYAGDGGMGSIGYVEWYRSMTVAISVLNEAVTRICLEAACTTQK